MPVHRSHRASAVRRPLAGVGFLSLLCGSRDRTQFIRLSHRHLHLLSHPAGPVLRIFFFSFRIYSVLTKLPFCLLLADGSSGFL